MHAAGLILKTNPDYLYSPKAIHWVVPSSIPPLIANDLILWLFLALRCALQSSLKHKILVDSECFFSAKYSQFASKEIIICLIVHTHRDKMYWKHPN